MNMLTWEMHQDWKRFAKKFSKLSEWHWVFVVVAVLARSLLTALHSLSRLKPPGPSAAVCDPQEPGTVCTARILTPTASLVSGIFPRFLVPRLLQEVGLDRSESKLEKPQGEISPSWQYDTWSYCLARFPFDHLCGSEQIRFFFFFLSGVSGVLFFPVNSTSVKVGSGLQSLTAQCR